MGILQIIRKSLDNHSNRRYLFIFFAAVLVMSYPLFTDNLFTGHDWTFHMLRIQSLKEGVLTGQFPVRVNPLFLNGYGYASSLFYPDLFLYIPVLFQLIGLGIEASYKLYLILCLAGGFLTAYFCGRGITKSSYAGIITAIVFSLSQYHMQNVYTRFSVGEIQAFIFLPFIAYGLYNLIYEEFDKPWLFIAGFTGLIYSHLLSTVLSVLVCAAACLFGMKSIFSDSRKIIKLAIAAGMTMGLTCNFWMPMAEQLLANRFEFQHLVVNWVHTRAVRIPIMFANSYLLKGRDVSIGISLTLLSLLLIFLPKASASIQQKKSIKWSMLTGFGLLFVASDLFPWQVMPPQVNSIQFPWRFYALASLFLSIGIGLLMEVLFLQKYKTLGLVLSLLFMGGSAITVITNSIDIKEGTVDLTPQYYQTPIHTNAISGGEWLPAGVEPAAISYKPLVVETNTGDTLDYEKEGLRTVVTYDADYDYIDVPSIYYRGYSVFYTDQTGNTTRVPFSNEGDNKSIRVYSKYISAPGTFTIDYTGTTIQKASFGLNLLFFLGLFLYIRYEDWLIQKIPFLQKLFTQST